MTYQKRKDKLSPLFQGFLYKIANRCTSTWREKLHVYQ